MSILGRVAITTQSKIMAIKGKIVKNINLFSVFLTHPFHIACAKEPLKQPRISYHPKAY
jgi:hypothetical protein